MLGVSQPTLSAWEGERKNPSVESLIQMSELYGVSVDFLLGLPEARYHREEQAEAFQAACGERFGADAVLNPANLIDAKKVELKTEKVSLSIDPEYSHLVEAKVIDGQKVLIIPVENHLEFNGVAVNVNRDKE